VGTEAEFRLGAGREFDSILGVFWGTGVGSGIILKGRPWSGRGAAGEIDPDAAAAEYEAAIAGVTLDLALLGLGEDGHTASLFPGSFALEVRDRLAVAVTASKPPPRRITLTLPVFQAARSIVMLAAGAGKAEAVAAVLAGPDPRTPASLVAGDTAELIVDAAAASRAGDVRRR
ncbi:MAG: 6-phosphogluconolactonase, partial [Gaiellales bacterium]